MHDKQTTRILRQQSHNQQQWAHPAKLVISGQIHMQDRMETHNRKNIKCKLDEREDKD
jgi:hypothetical protein